MKKIILIGLFYLFCASIYADVHVQLDPSQISIDDSFNLVITQDSLQNGVIPDLTPLQKNFVILGTERRMNYSIINGQAQSSSEWTVTLKPNKEGKLTIPAIKIGNESTQPTVIEVTASTTAHKTSQSNSDNTPNQNLYLTAEINKNNPYVNQQITYKVTLYNSKQLLNANYQGPQVENALLFPLGEEKRYQIQKNDVTYLVEEQNYAIFPQKSGPLKIKSPVFSALVYDFNPERVTAQDKTIKINVQPIPKEYSGKIWLPAKKVKLMEEYENSNQKIEQGNTLVRTVILEGVGIPAQLLPSLNFAEPDGINVYPEKTKNKNRITFGELVGRTEIKVTYLFNKAGKITIPELKLPWFNTESGKEEITTLPAKTFEVTPAVNAAPSVNASTLQAIKSENKTQSSHEMKESPTTVKWDWAWAVAALFAAGWIITLFLWGWQKRSKHSGKTSYKTALNDLRQACIQSNPQRTRDALICWARLYWPDASILNLTDITRLATDSSFKKQVQILSQVLYKNKERILWRGDELWRSVQHMKKNNTMKPHFEDVLPPMNPTY